jgi:membrane protease YdiL (CAAX protease family)
MVVLVLIGVRLRGSSLLTVLGDRWRSTQDFFRDAGIAVGFWIFSTIIISILGGHGGADNRAAQMMLPRGNAELALWMLLSVTAGICEEALFRGYLQRQFSALSRSVPVGIVLSAAVFGGAHAYQGAGRATMIAVQGVLLGLLAWWRRSLRPSMLAHTLQDAVVPFLIRVSPH